MKKLKKSSIKSKFGEIDYPLFYTLILILAVGIVMVYSASSYYAIYYSPTNDSTYFLKKQAMYCIIGFIAMIITMSIDYHKYKKITLLAMIATVILLLLVFAFPPNKGARRWIYIGPLSLQPSEIAKYVVVLYLALAVEIKGQKIKKFFKGVVPFLAVAGIYAALILAENNLSIASVIMITTFIILFAAGATKFHLFGIVAPAMTSAALVLALSASYRRDRMLNFLNPWKDPQNNGYQLIQSFYALGSGGLTGLGLGQSRQKTLYMPEPHNDFIFSIIGEELGLIGCIFIITLFVFLVIRGITIAMKAKDSYGMILAIGITSIIAVQSLINIAVVTGSMPVTGVPLPFISYGGTSLVINLTAMGILLNISRQREIQK
ncbi:stage V sporulation protein E [Clostridium sp. BJN0001]|uniref:stage V sporulation protein E n=1 Tax=Clostridium sp. BJN0001 TaxID=2930219 RepID=UPI001FD20841|nr:stage V sporulation protein E [Clostridium sp. BJN0001]